jgi:hypothetical protein
LFFATDCINLQIVPNYTEIAIEFQEEINRLLETRDNIDGRIKRLKIALESVEALAEESDEPIAQPPELSPDEEQGFTDQIRAIFKANPVKPLTAKGIRNLLFERNPKLDRRITLIHTHNTLRRLTKQDELAEVPTLNGAVGYKLKMKPIVDLMAALKESLAEMAEAKRITAIVDAERNAVKGVKK